MREYTGRCERHLGAHPSLLVTHRTSLRHTTLPFHQRSSVVHDALNTLHYAHCSLWGIHYAECAVPECQALVTVPEKVGNRQSEGEVHAATMMISARFFCICVLVFVYLHFLFMFTHDYHKPGQDILCPTMPTRDLLAFLTLFFFVECGRRPASTGLIQDLLTLS